MTRAFELRHPKHAIGEFSAVMELRRPVRQSEFSAVRSALDGIAERLELPATPTIQVVRVGLLQTGDDAPAEPIARQRFAPDGTPGVVITCDQSSVTYSTRQYTRWHEIWPVLTEVFAELAGAYLPAAEAINALRLQYLNEYRARGGDGTSTHELFRDKSRWLTPAAATATSYWHSHTGMFVPGDEGVRHLINVNADTIEAQFEPGSPARPYIKVVVITSCHYDQSGGLALAGDAMKDRIHADLNVAHRLERKTLAEVISDDYLEVMGALNNDY